MQENFILKDKKLQLIYYYDENTNKLNAIYI